MAFAGLCFALAGHSSGKDWAGNRTPPRFALFSTPEVGNGIVPFPFCQNNLSPLALRDDPARIIQKKSDARIIGEGFAVFCSMRGRLNLPARHGVFWCCHGVVMGFPVLPSLTGEQRRESLSESRLQSEPHGIFPTRKHGLTAYNLRTFLSIRRLSAQPEP